MTLVKCINGHTGCAAAERYLERGGRAIGHDFINLDCMELGGGAIGWAAEMDGLRNLHGNGEPYRGRPAITYRHYIVSPDPADEIGLEALRELARSWAERHFGGYQVAIVYHDDNERGIPHAHVVVNNTNVETGRRLHIPDPRELNRDLQQMARERGLGYFADEHPLYDSRAKGCAARTAQREYKGKAERHIEREGGYSWVADIRQRASIARTLSRNEADYRALLGAMGVELSLNSPNARRRDYLYSLAGHPARKVGGEKLGWPYGKQRLECEWSLPSALKGEGLGHVVEGAIQLNSLDELRELARTVTAIRESHVASIAEIDREIGRLEQSAGRANDPERRADLAGSLERTRRIRRFVAEHSLLPAETPKPTRERKPRSFDERRHHHHDSGSDHSSHHQQSISHDRGGYAR